MSEDKMQLSPAEAKKVADELFKQALKDANTYPAMYLVDWPGESVYACNNHAAQLITLGRVMGYHVELHGCVPGYACANCVNEAKKKGEGTVSD